MIEKDTEGALLALRDYLDQLGFARLYKYIVSVNQYYVNPNLVTQGSREKVLDFASYLRGEYSAVGLAACLMAQVPVDVAELSGLEGRVADRLVGVGLLRREGALLWPGPYQLISVQGMPLLEDARVNFPGDTMHEVYFGVDSLLLTYYVDTMAIRRDEPVLDLGTGSGLIGLFLSQFSDRVTVTDIAPAPLRLVHMNRVLNRKQDTVEIRVESYVDTLARGQRYQAVTFNPPFVPLPQELRAPIYAKGPGVDGQDWCRLLIERLDDVLLPDGTAYIVSDLPGQLEEPTFTADLRRYAAQAKLSIEVIIDNRNDYVEESAQFKLLGAFLARENPELSPEECYRRVETLHKKTLGAVCSHLSVMVVRRAADLPAGVRVLNRFQRKPPGSPE